MWPAPELGAHRYTMDKARLTVTHGGTGSQGIFLDVDGPTPLYTSCGRSGKVFEMSLSAKVLKITFPCEAR